MLFSVHVLLVEAVGSHIFGYGPDALKFFRFNPNLKNELFLGPDLNQFELYFDNVNGIFHLEFEDARIQHF